MLFLAHSPPFELLDFHLKLSIPSSLYYPKSRRKTLLSIWQTQKIVVNAKMKISIFLKRLPSPTSSDSRGNWMKISVENCPSELKNCLPFTSVNKFPNFHLICLCRTRAPFRIWSKTASSRTTSSTSASRRPLSRTSRFKFARGACPTLTLCWTLRCRWIRARRSSSVAFRVPWKHVSCWLD